MINFLQRYFYLDSIQIVLMKFWHYFSSNAFEAIICRGATFSEIELK